jgi:glycosyltransferase involved in cell wall biosynthesis
MLAGPQTFVPKESLFQYMDDFAANMIAMIESQELNYELIHAHFWMSGYVASIVKNILNIPFIITFHALGKVRRNYQGTSDNFPDIRFKIEEDIVAQCDLIVAECPQDQEDLLVNYFAVEEKIVIIPCGFDKNEFYPSDKRKSKKKLGFDPDQKIILQLGRMVPRKGVDNVIRSIKYLKDQDECNVKLVIVGGESDTPDPEKTPEIARLLAIAKEEGVENNIVFTGRKSRGELKEYYNAADVFVSTPWYEPFGITPLEAMACGTPVIGSNVGGIKYSVAHGKTGFLVPPNDPEILSRRVSEIIFDKNVAKAFRLNSIEHVNKFFTWQKVAEDLAMSYENMATNKISYVKKSRAVFKAYA